MTLWPGTDPFSAVHRFFSAIFSFEPEGFWPWAFVSYFYVCVELYSQSV